MMPPRFGSRYLFCKGMRDDDGKLYLTEREPFRYQPFPDNRIHTVVEGDTWFNLAGRYFAPLERACGYWWVIADFQPEESFQIDPTISLQNGALIHIPPTRVITALLPTEMMRRQS
jgi:hypothetical protein